MQKAASFTKTPVPNEILRERPNIRFCAYSVRFSKTLKSALDLLSDTVTREAVSILPLLLHKHTACGGMQCLCNT